jgi:hypothetical protein
MTSLQLDPGIFEQTPDRLPQDLLEKCAAMSVRTGAIKELVDSMAGECLFFFLIVDNSDETKLDIRHSVCSQLVD